MKGEFFELVEIQTKESAKKKNKEAAKVKIEDLEDLDLETIDSLMEQHSKKLCSHRSKIKPKLEMKDLTTMSKDWKKLRLKVKLMARLNIFTAKKRAAKKTKKSLK